MFVKRFFENYFLASAKPACRADFGCDFFCVYALIYVGNGGNIHNFFCIRHRKTDISGIIFQNELLYLLLYTCFSPELL